MRLIYNIIEKILGALGVAAFLSVPVGIIGSFLSNEQCVETCSLIISCFLLFFVATVGLPILIGIIIAFIRSYLLPSEKQSPKP